MADEALMTLALRVEALIEPDRIIDKEIHGFIDPAHVIQMDLDQVEVTAAVKAMGEEAWRIRGPGIPDHCNTSPRYTASLDAAMTLVPEGLSYTLYAHPGEAHCDIFRLHPSKGLVSESEQAATPALALCVAALRARALDPVAQSEGEGR